MSLDELSDCLVSTGMPVAYRAWPEKKAPPLPFICYLCTGNSNLYADASVYAQAQNVDVELYTRTKELETEAKVEAALAGFHWRKTEIYIDSERCYKITYEIEE